MEAGVSSYIAFLIVGVVLVFTDGAIIRRSGATYLSAVYRDNDVAESVNRLVTTLFHLTVLGLLALISTVEMNAGDPLQTTVARTGIMLLVLAAAHGITIWSLSRLRSRQESLVVREEVAARTE